MDQRNAMRHDTPRPTPSIPQQNSSVLPSMGICISQVHRPPTRPAQRRAPSRAAHIQAKPSTPKSAALGTRLRDPNSRFERPHL